MLHRQRLRTESSFGMPQSPYTGGTQAAYVPEGGAHGAGLAAAAAGLASPRSRLRTESSFGMPVSPYATFGADPMDPWGAAFMVPDPAMYMGRQRMGMEAAAARIQAETAAAWMAGAWSGRAPAGSSAGLAAAHAMGLQAGAQMPFVDGYPGQPAPPVSEAQRLHLHSLVSKPSASAASGGFMHMMIDPAPPAPAPSQKQEARAAQAQKKASTPAASTGPRTTVMLRSLPDGMTRDSLLVLLDSQGFSGKYDFAYLPVDFDTLTGLNHAFVNMASPEDAEEIRSHFEGFSSWSTPSPAVSHVAWNDKQQGLPALVERYRNSPVMHDSVPDECKPIIIMGGRRAAFPPPTQKIKAPKILKNKA